MIFLQWDFFPNRLFEPYFLNHHFSNTLYSFMSLSLYVCFCPECPPPTSLPGKLQLIGEDPILMSPVCSFFFFLDHPKPMSYPCLGPPTPIFSITPFSFITLYCHGLCWYLYIATWSGTPLEKNHVLFGFRSLCLVEGFKHKASSGCLSD